MKRIVLIIMSIAMLAMTCSCSKELTTPQSSAQAETHRYYVKYVISTEYTQAQAQVRNEKGSLVNVTGNSEYVFGPVNKGFVASLSTTNANRTTTAAIHVSIDDEPFAIKVFGESYSKNIELSYTVE